MARKSNTNNATVNSTKSTVTVTTPQGVEVVDSFSKLRAVIDSNAVEPDIRIENARLAGIDSRIRTINRLQGGLSLALVPEYMAIVGNEYYTTLGYNSPVACMTERYGISKQVVSQLKAVGNAFCKCAIDEATHEKSYYFTEELNVLDIGFAKLRTIAIASQGNREKALELATDSSYTGLSLHSLEDKLKGKSATASDKTESASNKAESASDKTESASNEAETASNKNSAKPIVGETEGRVEITCVDKMSFIKGIEEYITANPTSWQGMAFVALTK